MIQKYRSTNELHSVVTERTTWYKDTARRLTFVKLYCYYY